MNLTNECVLFFKNKVFQLKVLILRLLYSLPSTRIETLVSNYKPIPAGDLILDDICLPPFAGPNDHDDISPMLNIVKHYQPKVIFEMGTAHGNTVANICRQNNNAKIYTVNAVTEQQTGTYVTYTINKDDIGRVYKTNNYGNRVVQVYENTMNLDVKSVLKETKIDLGIVDACHDTEYVVNDFLRISPYINTGGIVLLHDTHPSMKYHLHGSYIACMLLRKRGYDIRHIKDTWWAIWERK